MSSKPNSISTDSWFYNFDFSRLGWFDFGISCTNQADLDTETGKSFGRKTCQFISTQNDNFTTNHDFLRSTYLFRLGQDGMNS
mmetsp:Transcript_105713/g.303991  ORF Transcript_105713/g.303991 Transcript_105713/m.303991 type:complete len:83 (-) Transcript_105713:538-786(-)